VVKRPSDPYEFPLACPDCKALSGVPYLAGTTLRGGAIEVGMRCNGCGHVWSFDMPVVDPIALKPHDTKSQTKNSD
jgi:hypothetical protein